MTKFLNAGLIAICLLVLGCNEDKLGEINTLPELVIMDNEGQVIGLDSIKTSLKNGTRFYELRLDASDKDNNLKSIRYEVLSGDVNVLQDNLTLDGNIFPVENGINLKIEPLLPGRIEIRFTVVDAFNETIEGMFTLVAFDNLSPVADLVNRKIGALGDLDFEIDASGSFDKDQRFGGGIVKYEYEIEDIKIETNRNQIRHIFRQVGFYVIRVRVQDNDGTWSQIISGEFLIQ